MKRALRAVGSALKRGSYLARAAGWATLLGIIETVSSKRGRRILGLLALATLVASVAISKPVRSILPKEVGIRINRLSGSVSEHRQGWVWVLPLVHELRRFELRDQVYRPTKSTKASRRAPFQSLEGLSIGVDVSVRYALDPQRIKAVALGLPQNVSATLFEPVIDGVLHRTFAKHTVREIFSAKRTDIEAQIEKDLAALLAADGVVVRDVFLGNVELPAEYSKGLEKLLAEELRSEKMRYTLALKQKQVKQSEFEALAEKVRREKAAEATAREQIIAARARAEAMKHVLPLKQKEIEQRRLEAEASRVSRLKLAQANAEARRIESAGEADSRRTLAKAEAYRLEVTGKARSEQLAREGIVIAKNPLLIQKTLADKLSDKIQVIVAPPGDNFVGDRLLGLKTKASR